jgi:REP element-mobilizing transposase RayT
MPQSLAQIYVHLVFSTKHRERVLADDIRDDLHRYLGGILNHLECAPVEINSVEDHVHHLLRLSRTNSLSAVVGRLKRASNDWLRGKDRRFAAFHWQGGYGAFSVSQSSVDRVRRYIQHQQEHHSAFRFRMSFALLRRYQMVRQALGLGLNSVGVDPRRLMDDEVFRHGNGRGPPSQRVLAGLIRTGIIHRSALYGRRIGGAH